MSTPPDGFAQTGRQPAAPTPPSAPPSAPRYAPPATPPATPQYAQPAFPQMPSQVPQAKQRNNFGVVALAAGTASVALTIISTVVRVFLLAQYTTADGSPYAAIEASSLLFTVVESVLALIALICGIAGLVVKHRPKGAAGVGLGMAISVLTAILMGALFSSLYQLFGTF